MAQKKDTRTRNWTFFVYPDSAPANWREILNEL
ncbi:replication protein, partial [Staphylococcus equorum]